MWDGEETPNIKNLRDEQVRDEAECEGVGEV